ncbi:HD domain-containing protein [Alkalibaculum bacchi]|uniref:HD domain-containing protein n=1 Tax=Alkalibaculum bacchi TaxID=645887 RepID=A0A366IC69_9FIRM|nr:HD domain-containing phosphohydrolase [Alkalibaculum bacchi]RBP66665.1 HD domain-containing protein [Alkalibaculum bacchi]
MQRHVSVNLGNLLLSLSDITDIANPKISHHQFRTAFIAVEIANYSGASQKTIENIFAAALLHDVGAISVEEKTELHNFKEMPTHNEALQVHAYRGELLLNQTPWFKNISKAVRYHHTNYKDMENSIDHIDVFSAQVVNLADYVERLVDRSQHILLQYKDIRNHIKKIEQYIIHPSIIKSFLETSEREEFWLDLVSNKLFTFLQQNGPYRNQFIDMEDIMHISEMYKSAIDFKSPFTATHTTGVAQCAKVLSEKFGLTDLEIDQITIAGYLHDIGKLIIPNSIIEKEGKLTSNEYAIMKSHTYFTYHTIRMIGGLEQIAQTAAYHHEKLDGSGYPFCCKQHEIGLGARIMTIADIFTAITEDRPYRLGMNKHQVIKILLEEVKNKKIDGNVVDLLINDYEEIEEIVKSKQKESRNFYVNEFISLRE